MGVENETLARAVKTLLDDELPAALDVVEAAWAATEDVTLADPVSSFLGHKPTEWELPATSYPFLSVIAPSRTPEGGADQLGFQAVTYDILIDYFVVGDDEATVNLVAMRYAQAIVDVLQAHKVIGGYTQRDYEPSVELTYVARREFVEGATGDAYDEADVDYVQQGRIVVKLS